MSIEHVFPADLYFADGVTAFLKLPGVITTSVGVAGSAPQRSRNFGDWPLQSYSVKLVELTTVSDKLRDLRRHLHHTLNLAPFWLPTTVDFYENVPGELTNGGRKTFIVPFRGTSPAVPSDLLILLGGAFQDSSLYTTFAQSNYLEDNDSNAVAGVGNIVARGTCTISRETRFSCSGPACFWVDPTGSVSGVGVRLLEADSPDISDFANRSVTFVASVRGDGDFQLRTEFFDSGHLSLGGVTTTSGVTCTSTEFTQITKTETAPSGSKYVQFAVSRTTTSSDNFAVGCLGIQPGEFERWFLPSLSPSVVEFDSAPSANYRLSYSATSRLMVRGTYSSPQVGWKLYYLGDAYPRSFTFVQELDNA